MSRVLLVTDLFPPQAGGRAEKMGRRAKYLHRLGFQVDVLAPAAEGGAGLGPGEHETLHARVHRTRYLLHRRWPSMRFDKLDWVRKDSRSRLRRLLWMLATPLGFVRWLPVALRRGLPLARQADVILSINNPVTLHVVGYLLGRFARRPWVAEMRDSVVGYAYSRRGPERLSRALESLIVHRADLVVQWNDAFPQPVAKRYPELPPQRFLNIETIGFDPDEVAQARSERMESLPPRKLRIAYTGSFYGTSIVPDHTLQALARLVREGAVGPEDIELCFAGEWTPEHDRLCEQFGVRPYVRAFGMIPHAECVALRRASNAVLFLLGDERSTLDLVPTKFWDYVSAERFVLALAPPDSLAARIVREHGIGACVSPTDVDAIAVALREMLRKAADGELQPAFSPALVRRGSCVPGEELIGEALRALAQAHPHPQAVDIAGFRVDAVTVPQLHERIDRWIADDGHSLVLHLNAHAVNIGHTQPWFRDFLNGAEVVFADGAGVLLAARMLGSRLPERITYADWMWALAGHCAANGYRLFLLGGRPGVAERAAERLLERFPTLEVCGTQHGYFDKDPGVENTRVVEQINAARPHILLVALGMPLQERWLRDNWSVVRANVALTAGAALDYVSGETPRGPEWMTRNGFEWLARLWFEPARLWRRYVLGNPHFLWRVLRYRFSDARAKA